MKKIILANILFIIRQIRKKSKIRNREGENMYLVR